MCICHVYLLLPDNPGAGGGERYSRDSGARQDVLVWQERKEDTGDIRRSQYQVPAETG